MLAKPKEVLDCFSSNASRGKKKLFQAPSSTGSSLQRALLGSHFSAGHDQYVVIWEEGQVHQAGSSDSEVFSLTHTDIVCCKL